MNRTLSGLILFAACTCPCGCLLPQTRPDPGASSSPEPSSPPSGPIAGSVLNPPRSQDQAARPGLQVVFLTFDVVRAEFPADGVRDARKIWNHVDELRVEPDLAALMAKNGVRLGVGSRNSWPAISAILDTSGAATEQHNLVAQAAAPVTIHLSRAGENEPIFTYAPDNRLTGQTVPGGEKLLILDYNVRPEADRPVEVRLTFEIRRDLGVMTWEKVNGTIREVPALERYTFHALRPSVSLSPGEFLAVGVGDTEANPYLMGNRFLTSEQDGETYETLLLLMPGTSQMTAAPARP